MKLNLLNHKLLSHDLMLHFFFGSMFAFMLTTLGIDPLLIAFLGFGLGIFIEIVDYFTGGQVAKLDVLYTALPGVILYILTLT